MTFFSLPPEGAGDLNRRPTEVAFLPPRNRTVDAWSTSVDHPLLNQPSFQTEKPAADGTITTSQRYLFDLMPPSAALALPPPPRPHPVNGAVVRAFKKPRPEQDPIAFLREEGRGSLLLLGDSHQRVDGVSEGTFQNLRHVTAALGTS